MVIKILPLDIQNDLEEISTWDIEFLNNPQYDSIKHFILEDNLYIGIHEVIQTNYEKYEIGEDERKFALSIKNNDDKIIGFILAIVDEIQSSEPELLIQYIVIHPEFQNQGIGTIVLSEIINNPEKYFNTKIKKVFSRIEYDNTSSIQMFKKLGFDIVFTNSRFMKAKLSILENQKE